jgi:geranylgeranyl pyrophosphate synthase
MRNAKKDIASEVLEAAIGDRGRRVQDRFLQVTLLGVTDSRLVSMIEEVAEYWSSFLRTALTSFCCEAVGGESSRIVDAGVVLNLFDAGLSIHDDIIDKTLRKRFMRKRFRMTILGTRGLENAVLVGDLLVVKAWSLICKMMNKSDKSTIASFAEKYEDFFIEMVEGEIGEISCRKNLDTALAAYQEILVKANSGVRACTYLGAILGGATKKQVTTLTEFGKSLSLMIGLRDDLTDSLNVEGYLPHRIENESVPFPLLYAAKSSKDRSSKIRFIMDSPSITPSDIQELLKICFEADAFIYLCKVVNQEAEKAHFFLDSLKPTPARDLLKSIVNVTYASVLELCP